MPHAFIPAAHCARVELFYTVNAVTCMNVFNVQKGTAYNNADLIALRTLVDNWDNATWKGSRGNWAVLFRIRCKALDTATSPEEDYYLPAPRAGTIGGQSLPGNVTFAFKLATGAAGRSFRGRWYLVGISSLNFGATANEYNVASANAIVSWLNLLKTNLAAGGHTLGVLSYRHDKAWRAAGVFTPAVTWTIVDYHLDSMRKRLTGRGI